MEEVYLKKYGAFVTENINFAENFSRYSEALNEKIYGKIAKEVIKSHSGIDEEEYKQLYRKTNPKYLNSTKKSPSSYVAPIKGFRTGYKLYDIVEGTPLKTLQYLQKTSEGDKANNRKLLKYQGEIYLGAKAEDYDDICRRNLIPFEDFLLTVRVYLTCRHRTRINSNKPRSVVPQVGQEFLVSSENTLADLRDKIACQEDYQDISSDISDYPVDVTDIRSGDVYKSGMFYIGNTFYIDNRHEDNIDYSEVIRLWAIRKKLDLTKTETMECKVKTLVARMGYPYVYVHQGNCEHLIVITDARLLHPKDSRVLNYYPTLLSFRAVKGKFCHICSSEFAKYIVCGSERLIYDSAFLCPNCTILYNYNGLQKVENFRLYKYIDRLGIL